MIELSKKYATKGGCLVELTRISNGYVAGVYRHDENDSGYPGVWSEHDGAAYWPANSSYADLIEVKPSDIEEMISWLTEMKANAINQGDKQRAITFDDAREEARRIRDSNATSDE